MTEPDRHTDQDPARDHAARPPADEWLCVGRARWKAPALSSLATGLTRLARLALPARVTSERWVRYAMDLQQADIPPSTACLTRVTAAVIERLRYHPDHVQNQLVSGLRFWDHGLRHAYIWCDGDVPLCLQWLLTEDDNAMLRTLPEWGGMYPPLPPGRGQVENLFTFTGVRRKGVAAEFEYALYAAARRLGLTQLRTHIAWGNVPAHRWAEKTGWRPYGAITQYRLDCPGLRDVRLYLHRAAGAGTRVVNAWPAGVHPDAAAAARH